ncbi:zinc ABC transporter permease [Floricoccus penangensis]|uniref:Zinc ABC transporter permease n=2 Tax=Floricoccus penangensis TaxID=1859475 RepID=A0A9Q5P0R8_9LACT|nr:metal ABC transporter permease [Floricoccus penangensis]OFI47430.1 zinc ABC transporter permease [Floricoccus penangensis]
MMEILQYDFMVRALLAIVAMSLFAPLLGVFLILRRQSLMSDTLSHVSLAGVAFGLLLGISPTITTLIVVVLAAILLEYLRTVYSDFLEVATAILMSLGLSVALIVTSKSGGANSVNIDQYLFGSIVTISNTQVILLFVMAAVILVLFLLFIRPMYVLTFDEDVAFVDGLPVRLMSVAFNVVTGIAIALMIPVAGALLVSAIMVMPASIALRLARSFKTVMLISVVLGFIGMVSGLLISYYASTPASASITIVFVFMFILMFVYKRLTIKNK